MIQKALPAVAYVRMSTDKQEDSPARQRGEIERYAKEHGYVIQEWYEDHGLTGTTSKKRKEFQRLMQDAKSRRFQFVLMYEQSRFSREDMLQFAHHLYELREVGVSLVTTLKGVIQTDDIGGMFMTLLESYKSRAESETIAHRTVSGKRRKLEDNCLLLGKTVFAFDRVILDATGNVVERIHFTQRYVRSKTHNERLEPSTDSKAVEAVRWAFRAVLDGISLGDIARHFNDLGLTTIQGRPWRRRSIRYMLLNCKYCGHQRIGHHARGKFAKITETVIIQENSHRPIVSPEVFESARKIVLGRMTRGRETVEGRYLLSGRLVCGRCGCPMVGGWHHTNGSYRCTQRDLKSRNNCCQACVSSGHIDEAVWNCVKRVLLSDENLLIAEAATRDVLNSEPVSSEAEAVAELERKIERATKRLAGDDLDDEQFSAVSNQWREWKAELKRLKRSLSPHTPRTDESKLTLEQLRLCAENLHLEDRVQIRDLLQELVSSVVIHRRNRSRVEAVVEFNPAFYFGAPVVLAEAEIFPDRRWWQVCETLRNSGREMTCSEIGRTIGLRGSGVYQALERGIASGVIQRLGEGRGCVYRAL